MQEDGNTDSHTPFFYTKHIYKMLDNALDLGITEFEFWNMTLAELNRLSSSKVRVYKREAQERATYDYISAALIGRAIARTMSNGVEFPELHEVYPSLFDGEAREIQKQEQKDQLSALRFKQFAQFHNQKFEGVANDK